MKRLEAGNFIFEGNAVFNEKNADSKEKEYAKGGDPYRPASDAEAAGPACFIRYDDDGIFLTGQTKFPRNGITPPSRLQINECTNFREECPLGNSSPKCPVANTLTPELESCQ